MAAAGNGAEAVDDHLAERLAGQAGVQEDFDAVVFPDVAVRGTAGGHHAIRLGFGAGEGDVERVGMEAEADLGWHLGGSGAVAEGEFGRGGRRPGRIAVDRAVQHRCRRELRQSQRRPR